MHDRAGCAFGQHCRHELVTVESVSLQCDKEIAPAD
jgi:hypothetical protein